MEQWLTTHKPSGASPIPPEAFYKRGIVLEQNKGDATGALADFNNAVRLRPNEPRAFYERANARALNGNLNGALSDFTEAIRLKPDYPEAFGNRALVRHQQGDFDGAIQDDNRAIQLRPDQ